MSEYRQVWTEDDILAAIRLAADERGSITRIAYKTAVRDAAEAGRSLPSASTIETRLGSWNRAVLLAGLQHGHTPKTFKWSDREIVKSVALYVKWAASTMTVIGAEGYQSWARQRNRPSLSVTCERMGSWNTALLKGIQHLTGTD
jgi:hypothetical protein